MALLVVTLSVMFAAFMSGMEAQSNSLPSCDELFEELTGSGFRVFVNVLNPESFTHIQQRDCLNNQFE